MYNSLTPLGIRIPHGFAVTASAYQLLLQQPFECAPPPNKTRMLARDAETVGDAINNVMSHLVDVEDTAMLADVGKACRCIIANAPIPEELEAVIALASAELRAKYGDTAITVAVRSSATAEDLPTASFAGQHDSYLNVHPKGAALLTAIRSCFASLYTDRAIRYRIDRGFEHSQVLMSVGVMGMVRSDVASAGVMFTMDTESGHDGVVFITGSYGLGENVVQGAVDPDEWLVHKEMYNAGKRCVMNRHLGEKKITMGYRKDASGLNINAVMNKPTPKEKRGHFCITDEEVLELGGFAIKIEQHYGRPMDIEWAKDGVDSKLWIVQARPETVASQQLTSNVLEEYVVQKEDVASRVQLVTGRAVGHRIAIGRARIITELDELPLFQSGEVLVADMTTPDWGAVMKRASAIVTNRGGRTCHAAIISRELGIPAVIGTDAATTTIKTGDLITVCCAEGDLGHVYAGEVPYQLIKTDLEHLARPKKVSIFQNVGNPDLALKFALLPSDGVGLARLEFIIQEAIGVHPMALLHPERIADTKVREAVLARASGFSHPSDFFVAKLAEGVGTIAGAFYPRPVVVRLSDFKTNEYRTLLGGEPFEAVEENPMLGFRGASRYTHPEFEEAFELEIAAMKRVRETMGFDNVILMVPFCRSPQEAAAVLSKMEQGGLKRGERGLKVYCMCELPVNVLMIDEFSQYFDGFSIGSNDLTQLTLGVDRDSEKLQSAFDERSPAVLRFLKMAIEGAKRNGRYIGICGQAPSDFPEIAEFLSKQGIDSMSLNPDSVVSTNRKLAALEEKSATDLGLCENGGGGGGGGTEKKREQPKHFLSNVFPGAA